MPSLGDTPELRAQARARIAPGAAVGVTEEMIHRLVHAFYGKVRADAVLGPIFDGQITDWDPHLARMCDFWSSVMLMTGRFKGQPMVVHVRIPGLEGAHFERWLGLFRDAAREVCRPAAAAVFMAKAEMIAQSLQLGIAHSRGELPPLHAAG
ncbi:group III truncated hemoglobin [Phenylobacterium sp.]|jgi:hemoglobin|uniref:group III truncated hemoglobin n=1 Tax=Phenylobacterium sp. TaxID=1871053 RepID=UPI002F9210CB